MVVAAPNEGDDVERPVDSTKNAVRNPKSEGDAQQPCHHALLAAKKNAMNEFTYLFRDHDYNSFATLSTVPLFAQQTWAHYGGAIAQWAHVDQFRRVVSHGFDRSPNGLASTTPHLTKRTCHESELIVLQNRVVNYPT